MVNIIMLEKLILLAFIKKKFWELAWEYSLCNFCTHQDGPTSYYPCTPTSLLRLHKQEVGMKR